MEVRIPKRTHLGHPEIAEQSGQSRANTATMAASQFDVIFKPTAHVTCKSVWPQTLACVSVTSIYLLIGSVVGYSAVLIPQLENQDSDIPVTMDQTSLIASLALVAVPFCALFNGYVVDSCGRLSTIRFAVIPYTIGWICIAMAHSVMTIYVGRILTGLTLAMGPGAAVVYTTEVARPDLRGFLLCMGSVANSIGILLTYIQGAFLKWRTIAWFNVGYALLPLLLTTLFSPESPAYLVSKGKNEMALKALVYLSRMGNHTGKPEEQLANILNEHEEKYTTGSLMTKLLRGITKPTVYKPFILLTLLFFFQQYSGVSITLFYGVTFFQEINGALDANISTILVGLVRLIMGLLTCYLLTKFGRRPLCICSGLGMSVMIFIAGYFTRLIKTGNANNAWMLWVPAIAVLLYISFSVIGLLTIPWTMTAELFPLELRGICQGIIHAISSVLLFSILYSYRYMTVFLGGAYAVHWLFATFSFIAVIFIWLFIPETHKKKLYEIQDYFADKIIIYPLYKRQH